MTPGLYACDPGYAVAGSGAQGAVRSPLILSPLPTDCSQLPSIYQVIYLPTRKPSDTNPGCRSVPLELAVAAQPPVLVPGLLRVVVEAVEA